MLTMLTLSSLSIFLFNCTILRKYILSSEINLIFIALHFSIITLAIINLFTCSKRKVYLVDFSCYKPKPPQLVPNEFMIENMRQNNVNFNYDSANFCGKIFEKSGVGPVMHVPEAMLEPGYNVCMAKARKEAETVMFGAVDQILTKTGLKPSMIGIVVVNCCSFSPVPSMAAMIVNRYKLREGVISYNITGMGCSASLLAVGLANQLLQVHKDTYALLVSADNMTENFYQGTNRAMLLFNCLFRIGGTAVLLSNRSSDRLSSKYELTCTAHTNTSSSDQSYKSVFQEEDIEGNKGITTSKDLAAIASESLKEHLTVLTPMILPVCLKLRLVSNNITRKLLYMYNIKPYMPNIRGSVNHFYNHVGAKPVQNAVQRVLKLSESDMEAPRMTLYRWGNTYSSSIWYELAYGEAKGRVRKGDCVWNIAYGSGFKCSSNIWSALRDIDARERLNPWNEEIDQFPVDSFNMEAFSLNFGPSN